MPGGMRYIFVPMNGEYAAAIIDGWKYDGPYSLYDGSNEAEHLLDAPGWDVGTFAVLRPDGELVGELAFEFFDSDGQHTAYADYGNVELISQREMWIGFGLRPDLVGQGWGARFVTACVAFAAARSGYRGEYVRLGVAEFNQRAIRAYLRAGFEVYDHVVGDIHGRSFACVYMRKRLQRHDQPPGGKGFAKPPESDPGLTRGGRWTLGSTARSARDPPDPSEREVA